jgi:heme-binding NEAT domain protein
MFRNRLGRLIASHFPAEASTGAPAQAEPTPKGAETTPEPTTDTSVEETLEDAPVVETPKVSLTTAALNERLSRAKGKERKELLESLGVESIEEAQNAIKAARQAELDKLSETERLTAELAESKKLADKERKARERVEQEKELAETQGFLTNACKTAALDPDVTEVVAPRLQKFIADNFGDDHEVSDADLKPFFDDLRSKKAAWFVPEGVPASTHAKPKNPPPSTTTPAAPTGAMFPAPPKPPADMSDAEWNAFRARTWG